nr:isoform 2 of probable 3-hydroxyisobutyrate dehydrogenase-like 1, mitochondrial [Quercus suber]
MIWIRTGVRTVLLDPTSGALSGLRHNGILVDMTTSEPSLAAEISTAASSKDCFSIDAPVSGNDLKAKNERLAIFAGGDESVVKRFSPLFAFLGRAGISIFFLSLCPYPWMGWNLSS